MAKKQKKKAELFETVQFQDFKRAKREVSFAKFNLIRIIIGFVLACYATYLSYRALIMGEGEWMAGFAVGMCAYLIGGGIGRAVKTVWRIAVVGWYLIPVFPFDVAFGLIFFTFGLVGMTCVPVIFVGLSYIQHKKTLDAAQRYLAESARSVSAVEE